MAVEHLIGPNAGRAGDVIVSELRSGNWSRLTAVVAFARTSGVRHVEAPLKDLIANGGRADLTLGVDLLGTTFEAAWYLMHAVSPRGRVLLASSEPGATFHPKVFIFSDAAPSDANASRALRSVTNALVVIGSSNLTGGGLYGNDEASTVWHPELAEPDDNAAWISLVKALVPWLTPRDPAIVGTATAACLTKMARAGRLPQELALPALRGPAGQHPSRQRVPSPRSRPRRPPPPALVGPPPPALHPGPTASPPGLSVLIARLAFGGARRWPQWELNAEVLGTFFGVTIAGSTVSREGVTRAGSLTAPESTPLVIGTNRNRRLEFPEPDGRPDPTPDPALLVVVDRRPGPFRYAVLLPADAEYSAVGALNRSSVPVGQYVERTRRVVVPYSVLAAVWPSCPL
jgi:hypothetical protein